MAPEREVRQALRLRKGPIQLAAGEDQLLLGLIQMSDRKFVGKRAPMLAMYLGQQFDRGKHGVAPTRSTELKGGQKARHISEN
jgi:hypothetical protein